MIAGGNYRTTRNEDGTITIHDVPVFCRCKRGDDDFDREWLDRALKKAKQAERDGHLPPLEIGHRQKGQPKPANAGVFRMKSIRQMQFKGRSVPALFTDWILTDEHAFEQIQRKRLLYRSVDLYHKTAEIVSCALLSEPPYLELPMVTVRDEPDSADGADGAEPWAPTISEDTAIGEPVLAFQRRGELTRAFMRGTDMPEASTSTLMNSTFNPEDSTWVFGFSDGKTEEGKGTLTEFRMARASFEKDEDDNKRDPDDKTQMEDPPVKKDDEGGDEGDKPPASDEPAGDETDTSTPAALCIQSIENGDIGIDDFALIMQAIDAKKAALAPDAAADPAADPNAAAPLPNTETGNSPIDQLSGDNDVDNKKLAQMQARLDVTETRLDERDTADKVREAVAATTLKFQHRPNYSAERATAYAEKHGLDAYADYEAELDIALPPAASDNFEHDTAQAFAREEPDEVTKFQKEGPEKYAKAKQFEREHAELSKLPGYRMSLERHLEVSFAREAKEAVA